MTEIPYGITEQEATEAMRRLAYWQSKAEEIERTYSIALKPYLEAVLAIEARKEAELERIAKRTEYHRHMVEFYAADTITETSKRKTVDTPFGSVSGRKQPDKYDYDEAVLMPFVEANLPEAVRIKREIDRNALKAAGTVQDGQLITPDGEVIPGVAVTPGGMKYTVKPLALIAPDAEAIEAEDIEVEA